MAQAMKQRVSCPGCYGESIYALDRNEKLLSLDVGPFSSVSFRTRRGKLLPIQFVANVVCQTCPLKLEPHSFARVWRKAGAPLHLAAG
jgi:hypothetical protein